MQKCHKRLHADQAIEKLSEARVGFDAAAVLRIESANHNARILSRVAGAAIHRGASFCLNLRLQLLLLLIATVSSKMRRLRMLQSAKRCLPMRAR